MESKTMRLTKEEIKERSATPTLYDGYKGLGDTVKIYYGDEPAFKYRVNMVSLMTIFIIGAEKWERIILY